MTSGRPTSSAHMRVGSVSNRGSSTRTGVEHRQSRGPLCRERGPLPHRHPTLKSEAPHLGDPFPTVRARNPHGGTPQLSVGCASVCAGAGVTAAHRSASRKAAAARYWWLLARSSQRPSAGLYRQQKAPGRKMASPMYGAKGSIFEGVRRVAAGQVGSIPDLARKTRSCLTPDTLRVNRNPTRPWWGLATLNRR